MYERERESERKEMGGGERERERERELFISAARKLLFITFHLWPQQVRTLALTQQNDSSIKIYEST